MVCAHLSLPSYIDTTRNTNVVLPKKRENSNSKTKQKSSVTKKEQKSNGIRSPVIAIIFHDNNFSVAGEHLPLVEHWKKEINKYINLSKDEK